MPTAEENPGGCLDMDSFDNEVDMFISNQNRKLMDLKLKDNVSLFASETKPECSEVDIVTDNDKANKHIVPKKPELNDNMYNWVIAKYGKPNTEPVKAKPKKAEAETAEPKTAKPGKPANVQEFSNIKEKEDQQDVHPDTEVIVIGSSSSKLECSSTSESSSYDDSSSSELSSYVSSYDESRSSDKSGCLEKSVPDVNDQDEEEIYEEYDERDKEAEDGKDDYNDELWSPKTIGTTAKNLISPKMKGASSNSTPSTKKQLVKSSEPIRNCIIGLGNNKTWEMIVYKEFGVKKKKVKDQVKESKEQVKKGKKRWVIKHYVSVLSDC
ncbi:hypothetical protein Tco_0827270 [Tanacetum coccineum]